MLVCGNIIVVNRVQDHLWSLISHIAVRYMAHHQSHTPRADAGKLVVVVVRNISYNHPRISAVTYMLKTNEKKADNRQTNKQALRLWKEMLHCCCKGERRVLMEEGLVMYGCELWGMGKMRNRSVCIPTRWMERHWRERERAWYDISSSFFFCPCPRKRNFPSSFSSLPADCAFLFNYPLPRELIETWCRSPNWFCAWPSTSACRTRVSAVACGASLACGRV